MDGGAQLFAQPLAAWERGPLKSALTKAGLPSADIESPPLLFWRFERDDMPVGFGGLEICGEDALLRSLLTLPPVRRHGFGTAMVAAIEAEAAAHQVRGLYLLTTDGVAFFARLGYVPCRRDDVPVTVRASAQFAAPCAATAAVMGKEL
jgi:N-acetylglutamate synthase-like GNAT family acetyltransferase